MPRISHQGTLLDKLKTLFRPRLKQPSVDATPSVSAGTAQPEEGWHPFSFMSGSSGIQVVEVEQAEFVMEWGQTVVQEAHIHEAAQNDATQPVDLRLPNYDRRQGKPDRRSGDRRNGNGAGESVRKTSR